MRDLNECRAEVFRRSEQRIKQRKRKYFNMVKAFGLVLTSVPLCLLIVMSVMTLRPSQEKSSYAADNAGGNKDSSITMLPGLSADDFAFSLTWGCYGISSYDSESGKLVKTSHATNPDEYITTYYLTEQQEQKIYNLIMELDVDSYPNSYNPQPDGRMSFPSFTLILSVRCGATQKTITAKDIVCSYESEDAKGQKFLTVCKEISEILEETEEWKALPEYEFFYD